MGKIFKKSYAILGRSIKKYSQ